MGLQRAQNINSYILRYFQFLSNSRKILEKVCIFSNFTADFTKETTRMRNFASIITINNFLEGWFFRGLKDLLGSSEKFLIVFFDLFSFHVGINANVKFSPWREGVLLRIVGRPKCNTFFFKCYRCGFYQRIRFT